ncbi:uncharacterized protein OCT59_022211 [Rhizophagus irregularis]|nr:hypothetical protein OCT59_022211 [Rhizophagus irregularis]
MFPLIMIKFILNREIIKNINRYSRYLNKTQGIVLAFNTTGVMVHPPFCRPILMITVWAMFVMGALHHEDSSLRGDEFQKQERIPWRNVDYSGRKSHYDGTELAKRPSALNLTISKLSQNWGHCAELVLLRALHGQRRALLTEIDTSMCIVRTCDENNETNGLCRKSRPMVVDTIIKSNRNSVATSLGHELQGQYQDDDIDYVKESSCILY